MLSKFKKELRRKDIDPASVTKVFILTGSNNVDLILSDSTIWRFNKTMDDISKLITFVHNWAMNASVNMLNLLPRKFRDRNVVINDINNYLHKLSHKFVYFNFVNTEVNRYLFATADGFRKDYYFTQSTDKIPDNVHLNDLGVERLGKHLKYLAHNTY